MKIKKTYQGVVPNGKILNDVSDSPIDTYSCDYINNMHNDTGLIGTKLVPFSDGYSYKLPNTTLGVDDCTKYIWQISATDWSTIAYIVGINKTEILLRVWKLSNPTSGNVTLLKDATNVDVLVRGIRTNYK